MSNAYSAILSTNGLSCFMGCSTLPIKFFTSLSFSYPNYNHLAILSPAFY
ncbi:hypothetical protein DSUL_20183 [Desulfovibrionales bacterium]